MEQKAMVRFFTLKGLNLREIHAELVSIYGPMHLFYQHFTNGTSPSPKGEQTFSIIRDLDNPDRMMSLKSSALCFRNFLLFHAKDFMPTSDL
jgi:hypothetical protein